MNEIGLFRGILGAICLTGIFSLAFLLTNCGSDSKPVRVECHAQIGDGCVGESNGDDIIFTDPDAQSGNQFALVVFLSEEPKDLQAKSYNVRIRVKPSSNPIDMAEQRLIAAVQNHANGSAPAPSPQMDPSYFKSTSQVPTLQNSVASDGPRPYFLPEQDIFSPVDNGSDNDYISPQAVIDVDEKPRQRSQYLTYRTQPGLFELDFDPKYVNVNSSAESLNSLFDCLTATLPDTFDILGGTPPYFVSPDHLFRIVITNLSSSSNDFTIGRFAESDLFLTRRGKRFENSSHGEFVYVTPGIGWEEQCSTVNHEHQHQWSFKYKDGDQIPSDQRTDFQAFLDRHLHPEMASLNEAMSHLIEELTGRPQEVADKRRRFLTHPQNSSFYLLPRMSYEDSSAARGAAIAMVSWLIRHAGGTLKRGDPQTKSLLAALIQSPDTGFENLAKHFQMSVKDLLKGFFTALMNALFDSSKISDFNPPRVIDTETNVSRGLQWMKREDPIDQIPFASPYFHPLEFPLPILPDQSTYTVRNGGMLFFRYISSGGKPEFNISSGGAHFHAFLIPLPYKPLGSGKN